MIWRPVRENHAIERVAISFSFEDEITLKTFTVIQNVVSRYSMEHGFVRIENATPPVGAFHHVVQIQFQPGSEPILRRPEFITFRRDRDGHMQDEIVILKNGIVFSSSTYSRWDMYKQKCRDFIGPALQLFFETTNLITIKLEYWDRFNFKGHATEAEYGMALNARSRHLPKMYLEGSELWHSHVGYFQSGSLGQKQLINANVDVVDLALAGAVGPAEPVRSIGIYTMAEDRHFPAEPVTDQAKMWGCADELHRALKVVLGDLINQELADAISLQPGSES